MQIYWALLFAGNQTGDPLKPQDFIPAIVTATRVLEYNDKMVIMKNQQLQSYKIFLWCINLHLPLKNFFYPQGREQWLFWSTLINTNTTNVSAGSDPCDVMWCDWQGTKKLVHVHRSIQKAHLKLCLYLKKHMNSTKRLPRGITQFFIAFLDVSD